MRRAKPRRKTGSKAKNSAPKKRTTDKKVEPAPIRDVIYLDNNGTTQTCEQSKQAMIKWMQSCANPSSDSRLATQAGEMLACTRKYILKHCSGGVKKYSVIFTSGASESNCLILLSVADAYAKHKEKIPHIITSATEHKSIIKCCQKLRDQGRARITFVEPNAYGCISPALIGRCITDDTALISIMAANNEIGCINNLKAIGKIAHEHKVPFHTDAVQLFGKYKIPLRASRVDAMSMSFHKLYGPMGLGLLIISNELIDGYGLEGQIAGSQQGSLRGGTENVPCIAGAMPAIKCAFTDRVAKNKKMYDLKNLLIYELGTLLPQGEYKKYFSRRVSDRPKRNEFVVLGPADFGGYRTPNVLPNTLLLSFAKNHLKGPNDKPFCNVQVKKALNKKGVIVSVGSACATSSKKASHVLYSIRAPPVIRQGVMRISLSDHTTREEIEKFIEAIRPCLEKQGMLDC